MHKLLNKLFAPNEQALIRKDLTEIGKQRLVRSSLLILPLLMAVGIPLLFLLVSVFAPTEQLSDVVKCHFHSLPFMISCDIFSAESGRMTHSASRMTFF